MKASPRQQQLLLNLQEFDNALARLRRRREQLPQRAELAAMAGELTAAKNDFMSVQRELDTQKADIQRLESDIEMVQQRITRDEQMLAASTSPKEAQALQGELETLAKRRGDLEDRELELMEVNEEAQSRYDQAAAALGQVDQRKQSLIDTIVAGEGEIDAEIARTTEERAGLAAELQRDLLNHYETLRSRLGVAVARLRGRISEASNMELAPAELSGILETPADELVYCPQSGAILVREFED